MSTWDEEFRQLQAEFLRGGPSRLADIDETLDRLDRGTAATLAELKRHFHQLAGAGATYQRPQISSLAREAERRGLAAAASREPGRFIRSSRRAAAQPNRS